MQEISDKENLIQEKIDGIISGKQNRRDFLKYLLTTAMAGFAVIVSYPVLSFLKPPKQREVEVTSVSAGKVNDFAAGDSKIIRFGNDPVILINKDGASLVALSATCTHLDCTVQYKKDEKIIWCTCHNGKYDLQGRNISGPPPRPLDQYMVKIKDEEIFITKKS
ncbi:MAG TPA: ubiquinol-cytochrome c reductase iron-sulfur subunit [Ignavibacteriaceae bacterium]|nr:ubiquinol-cytochrome c reductase iron-sulfur subunit [Ignavibacteriaceae bacterium]